MYSAFGCSLEALSTLNKNTIVISIASGAAGGQIALSLLGAFSFSDLSQQKNAVH